MEAMLQGESTRFKGSSYFYYVHIDRGALVHCLFYLLHNLQNTLFVLCFDSWYYLVRETYFIFCVCHHRKGGDCWQC